MVTTEEYRALRATIRERGTSRAVLAVVIFVAWATLLMAVQAWMVVPVMALVPLAVLAAGFEVIFALHTGVERIGRYLQVYYEAGTSGAPAWEHTAMQWAEGGRRPRTGLDPLHIRGFLIAAFLNFVPVTLLAAGPESQLELSVYGTLHLLFVARLLHARSLSGRQRVEDLERFRALRSGEK